MNANNIPISIAIRKLTSSIKWSVVNDYDITTIQWNDTDVVQPTVKQIESMRQQMANEQNAIEYVKLRTEGQYQPVVDDNGETIYKKVEDGYPTFAQQLDLLYHDIEADNLKEGSWITAIRAVKQKFPKSS